jgi:uncharacterized protein (TIGR00251 family)
MRTLTAPIVGTQDGIRITIHVVPNAKGTEILLERDGGITMRVHAPPVKGKANREIVKWLSKKLRRPSSQIRIVNGIRSNLKAIEIIGMDERSFAETINPEASGVPVKNGGKP